ncbi:MAG TPA: Ig-like domain-containing protein [Candidatus Eisenbacteria bacterium]|nr:Ig-like domain-containing protein [Candidatus Eisenbacteria bacterium]
MERAVATLARIACAAAFASLATLAPSRAHAVPGSGTATIAPSTSVPVGTAGTWVVTYVATESFAWPQGGRVRVQIPSGWTAPQTTSPAQPGYVRVLDMASVHQYWVTGSTIEIDLGRPPENAFAAGDMIRISYGDGGGAAAASAPTTTGSATFLVSSDPAGNAPAPLTASPSIAVAPGPPNHLALEPAAISLTAGVPDTIVATVRDSFGNRSPLASGETFTLWTDRPGGRFRSLAGPLIFQTGIPLGGDSVAFTFTDTEAGGASGRIEVIDTNGSGTSLGTVAAPVATAPNVPSGNVTLAVIPDTLDANGAATAAVSSSVVRDAWLNVVAAGERFTVRDSLVTPLGDVDPGTPGVQWGVGSGGTLSGSVRAKTTPGLDSVTVASARGAARGARAIRLLAGPPVGTVPLVATPDSVAADGVATRAVTAAGLVDANGNTVRDGEPFTVSTTLGTIVSPDQDPSTTGIQVRAVAGAIGFTLLGGDVLGVANVSAASVRGSASGAIAVRVVPGAVDPARSTAVAPTPSTVGPTGSVLTVTLRDAKDHAIPGVSSDSIAVAVTGVPATAAPLAAATGASGSIQYRITTTLADTAVVDVTARGVTLAARPSIEFRHGPLDTLVIAGPAGPLASGVAQSLHVTARDAFGNEVVNLDGSPLGVSLLTGGASLPSSVPFSGGEASVPFTPTLTQPLTIRVTEGGGQNSTYGPVSVAAGPAYRLTALPLAPGSNPLAAGDSLMFRARVTDAGGNPVTGTSVSASVIAGSGGVAPAGATTDALGEAAFQLTSGGVPGPLGVRLLAGASAAPDSVRADTVSVTVVPGATASLEVVADSLTWTAGDSVRVQVRARDAFGNLVVADGATVSMNASGSVRWSPPSGSFGGGVFVSYGRDTVSESIAIGATRAGGITGSGGIAVVRPAAPSRIDKVAGDGQSAVVTRELSLPLRVRARDAFGNAVPAAAVLFRVTAGGGSLDATRGGAADSIVFTDVSGLAACEVVRVGTVAGAGTDSVEARLLAMPSARVTFGASALADTAVVIALAPAGLSLSAGGTGTVTATARDAFGNLAPGVPLTFYLGGPAFGTLESLGATTGGPGSQSGVTSALGTLAVRYRAPSSAPATDSVFVRGATLPPVGIAAQVGASATASLRVEPDLTQWTAGQSVRVTVRAVDAFGNPVTTDNAVITMSSGGSVRWSPVSGPLVGGVFQTFARDTVAESVASIQASRAGGGAGGAGPILVVPAAPSGAIAVAASRTTLTADGRSTASLTLGPVRDPFGNTAASGTTIEVRAGAATLVGPDASPLDSLQLLTGADGRASLILVAPATTGTDLLRATSGAASGSQAFLFEPPPSLTHVAGSLAPAVVVPGLTVAFTVSLTNSGAGTIQLGPGTTLSFGAGASAFTASLGGPVSIPQGQTSSLGFAAAAVPGTLTPGTYAPALRVVGVDGTGEPFDFYPSLAGAQVHAAGVSVAAVAATPSPVPLGFADLSLVFDVTNPTALAAVIDAASLAVSPGVFTVNSVTPPLPAPLPAGGTTRLTLSVRVPASGLAPGTPVSAQLTATASFAGSSVTGVNAAPLPFTVESAARIAAVPGGAAPARYLRSRSFAPGAIVENTGTSAVTLARDVTRLLLQHPGGDALSAGLRAATAVAGGDTAALAFDSLAVPGSVARGRYAAKLVLSGTEAGQAFADTIPLAPDSVSVLEPPVLAVTAPVDPAVVSAGQARPLRVTVVNSGDVPFTLDPATALRLGAPLSVVLGSVAPPPSVPAGGSVSLDFSGVPLGTASLPGIASLTLEARGAEDGAPREESVPAGTLDARAPSTLAYVAGSAAPDTVRAGETHDITLLVRNDGGSPFLLDPAASRLVLSDGVEQVVATGSGAPFALDPAAQATLTFPAASFPAALASQSYPVTLVLRGTEWGLADSATVTSGGAAIAVIEQAAGIQVRGFDTGAPAQVAPGAQGVRVWGIELTPLVPPGATTAARLHALRFRVLADGSEAPSAGNNLGSISIRGTNGILLAQAAGGVPNPVRLDLVPPLAIASRAESVTVEVTLAGAPTARAVALRIAVEPDVVVLDDLTGTPVPIRGGGGLAFTPIVSPTVTLYDRAHGYPNPFHAGREAVRLSYVLPDDAAVRIAIYTLLGTLVREISLPAGAAGGARGLNEVPWDGRNGAGEIVRPGVYVAEIQGAGASERIKVGVLR